MMDNFFEPPLSEEEIANWEVDLSLLPDDEPLLPDDDDPPGMPDHPGDGPGSFGDDAPGNRLRAPYTYVHGRRACHCLAAVVSIVEKNLVEIKAIHHDLSGLITQQSYNGTAVSASAGTHAGGGVWDVKWALVNSDAKKRAWFAAGIIPFERLTLDAPRSKWPRHGHVVVAGCPHRSRSAAEQEKAARLGRNALANDRAFRGVCGPIITWEAAVARDKADSVHGGSIIPLPIPEIPRHRTPKPWPSIAEDGNRGPQTMDRLRMQLNLATTGSGQWSHWDVAALLVWLCEPCGDTAVITPVATLKLQHRVGTKADGNWGPVTTRALQHFLNQNR